MGIKVPTLPPFVLPKSLGQCADAVYLLRQDRLSVQKLVEEIQKRETQVRDHIINTLPASQASGIAGKVARVTIVPKQIARAADWGQIFAYVKKEDAFDLLQRRLSEAAVDDRWEQGIEIPGIEKFGVKTLSVNKV